MQHYIDTGRLVLIEGHMNDKFYQVELAGGELLYLGKQSKLPEDIEEHLDEKIEVAVHQNSNVKHAKFLCYLDN